MICKGLVLLIYKNGRWDLPKGGIQDNYTKKDNALKEVSEETGLDKKKLSIKQILPSTYYHKKTLSQKYIKKIYWYEMSYEGNLADTTPQIKEDIYGCVWFTPKQLLTQLENTKEQIRYVIDFWLQDQKE
ncbi:hypothetical protein [uncultured Gammaproteobacteria bacterium]|nr:hypothetical protein [uncultured Gammaproteobacteria bacterium]CAC9638790.1 hypothetical protein [uncultured Gammaproteobacteria bacterium]CAC9640736.1 hypothetical protein [uncultured Gammaproteobacteria bacterium]CAC9987527.1 hypothetical protein [uncultured Gammaproteobacteria bacterium]VVH51794.1 hypothetical protein BPUTSESOX_57 [uncultured Gammaproteobacteria bacterium]